MNQLKLTTATLDTNVFPAEDLLERASQQGIAAAAITVSRREAEGSSLEEEISALESVAETGVWDESRWDEAVWGSEVDAQCLERALDLLSNRGFPQTGKRDELTAGQRRQLRDAMILCAHIRSGRDVLVSNDRRAFIDHGRREAIEATFGTKVMTVAEFEQYLLELEQSG